MRRGRSMSIAKSFSWLFLLLLGFAGHAGVGQNQVEVKNPERFTAVKEWNLSVQWDATESFNQKPPNTYFTTKASLSFSGNMQTVLKEDPDEGGWTNQQDSSPLWDASFTGEKEISAPEIKTAIWRYELSGANTTERRPSAGLSINLRKGIYILSGEICFMRLCTKMDETPPMKEEGLVSVPILEPNLKGRQEIKLPEEGNDLSGDATFPLRIGPFSDLDPDDFEGGMPQVAMSVPLAQMHVKWTLTPKMKECRFEYKTSPTDLYALKRDILCVGPEVAYDAANDFWWIHANYEGQVYVDGDPQLKIDKTSYHPLNTGRFRVTGKYPIRRLARSWTIKGDGKLQPIKESEIHLPNSWVYDSPDSKEDWLDIPSMQMFREWSHQGVLDEFLIGVLDDHPTVFNPDVEAVRSAGGAQASAKKYFPGDKYYRRVAGLPEFHYVYVAFVIETCPFPKHPMVFRVTYFPSIPLDSLEAYKNHYQMMEPPLDYAWHGTSHDARMGWKEVVKKGKGWAVVDFTPTE